MLDEVIAHGVGGLVRGEEPHLRHDRESLTELVNFFFQTAYRARFHVSKDDKLRALSALAFFLFPEGAAETRFGRCLYLLTDGGFGRGAHAEEKLGQCGVVAGLMGFWACTRLKHRFKYDDSLDVFGVHGVGGMTGILLTGVFATSSIGEASGLLEGNPRLLPTQLYGIAVTLAWSAGITFALLKLISAFVPVRVSLQQELEGLDISQHGEALQ